MNITYFHYTSLFSSQQLCHALLRGLLLPALSYLFSHTLTSSSSHFSLFIYLSLPLFRYLSLSPVYHNHDFSLSCFITSCCFYGPSVELSAFVTHTYTHTHTFKGLHVKDYTVSLFLPHIHTHSHTCNHLPSFYFSLDKQLQPSPSIESTRKRGRGGEERKEQRVKSTRGCCHAFRLFSETNGTADWKTGEGE